MTNAHNQTVVLSSDEEQSSKTFPAKLAPAPSAQLTSVPSTNSLTNSQLPSLVENYGTFSAPFCIEVGDALTVILCVVRNYRNHRHVSEACGQGSANIWGGDKIREPLRGYPETGLPLAS